MTKTIPITLKPALHLECKTVCGRTLAYPACDKSKALADMLGSASLPGKALRCAERLGFRLVETAGQQGVLDVLRSHP